MVNLPREQGRRYSWLAFTDPRNRGNSVGTALGQLATGQLVQRIAPQRISIVLFLVSTSNLEHSLSHERHSVIRRRPGRAVSVGFQLQCVCGDRTGLRLGAERRLYDCCYRDRIATPIPSLAPNNDLPFLATVVAPGTIGTTGGSRLTNLLRSSMSEGDAFRACTPVATSRVSGPRASLGFGMTFGYIAGRDITNMLP